MSPPCSSVTQQQLEPPSLPSRTCTMHATLSLWWPLLENTGEKEVCFFNCKVNLIQIEHDADQHPFYTFSVPLGAPQSLEAIFVQSTEVFLSWRELPCDQNGYIVRYYATCGSERNAQQSQSVVTTGITIDGLTPITEYVFQVAAVNVNGTGPFTEPLTLGGK